MKNKKYPVLCNENKLLVLCEIVKNKQSIKFILPQQTYLKVQNTLNQFNVRAVNFIDFENRDNKIILGNKEFVESDFDYSQSNQLQFEINKQLFNNTYIEQDDLFYINHYMQLTQDFIQFIVNMNH